MNVLTLALAGVVMAAAVLATPMPIYPQLYPQYTSAQYVPVVPATQGYGFGASSGGFGTGGGLFGFIFLCKFSFLHVALCNRFLLVLIYSLLLFCAMLAGVMLVIQRCNNLYYFNRINRLTELTGRQRT